VTSLHNAFARISSAFGLLRSAAAIAGAVESNATPELADLRRLGIEPRAILSMGHG